MEITNRKEINKLTYLLMLAYMISYITRINYGAVISEIESATSISRSVLSLAVTGSFITYGAGQIVSGVLGDMISPKKLVSTGFALTSLMNFLIAVFQKPYLMIAVWCINGFAQSLMWPPIVKIMTSTLSEAEYNKASVKVLWGSSFGTIAIYLISPLAVAYFNWKAEFVFSGLCGLVMLLIWNKYIKDIEPIKKERLSNNTADQSQNVLFTPLLLISMLAMALLGMIRDGVTTWMPSYILETYDMSSIISILTGVVLPVFAILGVQVAQKLYNKVLTNPVLCAGVIFGIGTVFAIGVSLCSGYSMLFSVLLISLLSACMHGANLMLVVMVPVAFKESGKVSTASGAINLCTYIGSALSTYFMAILSEKSGWGNTVLMLVFVAGAGMLICLGGARFWTDSK